MSSLLDVLRPATPPEPKNAKVERIADGGSDPVVAQASRDYRARNRERIAERRRNARRKAAGEMA